MSFSRRTFVHRVDTYVEFVVCSSKPYVNKLILRSSRPSTSLYALAIKANTVSSHQVFHQDGIYARALTTYIKC